jgi:hypothetical protein
MFFGLLSGDNFGCARLFVQEIPGNEKHTWKFQCHLCDASILSLLLPTMQCKTTDAGEQEVKHAH